MSKKKPSSLQQANKAFIAKDYALALTKYEEIVKTQPSLAKAVEANIKLTLARLKKSDIEINNEIKNNIKKEPKKEKNEVQVIVSSIFFDAEWCKKTYPIKENSSIQLAKYYLEEGWKAGYDPSPRFSTQEYLKSNPDVAKASINPLLHYEIHGKEENRGMLVNNRLVFLEKCKRLLSRRSSFQEWDKAREASFIRNMNSVDKSIENLKVSIIMPTWNRADCIGRAIQSVINQTHQNWSLIIVDDGSSDRTREKVNSFTEERIQYIQHSHQKGVSAARNTGLRYIEGEWVFFIDSDNEWKPLFLTTMLQYVTKAGLDAAYCGANLIKDDPSQNTVLFSEFEFESCALQNYIDLNTFCVSSKLAVIGFNEQLRRLVDWDYMLQIAVRGCIRAAPFIGVDYYDGDNNNRITRTEYRKKEEFSAIRQSITNRALNSLTNKPSIINKKQNRIAVVFHIFHLDHLDEYIDYLKNIDKDFHLYITTSYSTAHPEIKKVSELFENTVVLQYPNIGKDIAPFLELLSTLVNYDAICKIHTKRDVPSTGSTWRQHSLDCLLGSAENINKIIESFTDDPKVNLIGPKEFYKSGLNSTPDTLDKIKYFVNELELDEKFNKTGWGYFAGTMFWFRPNFLISLARYFCDNNFYSSDYAVDGQFEHAIERLIGLISAENLEESIQLVNLDTNGKIDLLQPSSAIAHFELPITKTLKDLSVDYKTPLTISSTCIVNSKNSLTDLNEKSLSSQSLTSNKLFFYPDYRINNAYQELLYREVPNCSTYPGSIEKCLNDIYSSNISASQLILHLHWLHPLVTPAQSIQEAREKVDDFLEKAKLFVLSGGRILWTVHNVVSHEPRYLEEEIRLTQGVIELAEVIHVHHAAVVEFCQPHYTLPLEKVVVAEHGNYIGTLPVSIDRKNAQLELKIPENATVFLFLGQIRIYKGIDDLLLAFSEIVKKDSQSYLVLAGKVLGVDENDLADRVAQIPNTIFHPGYVSDDRMQVYLKSADVMVLPYKKVLTSGSIFLAMSFGLPVICPRSGLLMQTVTDHQNGFLYDPNASSGLLTAMNDFNNKSRSQKQSMSKNAFDTAKEYSWKDTGRKLSLFLAGKKFGKMIKTKLVDDERTWFLRGDINKLRRKECIVTVVHYQNINDTFECIKRIQSQQGDIGIVIISNNEWINDACHIAEKFTDIIVVQSENNSGFAAANNFGLWLCRFYKPRFFWLLNPDIILPDDFYYNIVKKTNKFPSALHFGSTITHSETNKVLFCGGDVFMEDGARPSHRFMGSQLDKLPKEPFVCDYLTGANIFSRGEALSSIGYIPEHYFLYFEETDWFITQNLDGNPRPIVFPDLVVKNRKRSEIGSLPARHYLYYFIRNALIFGKRFAPDNISRCEDETRKFAEAWLYKIKKNAPDRYTEFEELVSLAFKDGFDAATGPAFNKI